MSDFLDRAIQAHVQWKIKLTTAINGGEVPSRQTSAVDNGCELGRWIYGEGQALKARPEFAELQRVHRAFHSSLGKVIDLLAAKKFDEAKREMSAGEFAKCSSETAAAITKLRGAMPAGR